MDKQEKMVNIVKKLLALGDKGKNTSDKEAQAALLKAQELMAKHNLSIDMMEITDEVTHNQEVCEHKWDMGFRTPLGKVIADNFRCKVFMYDKRIVFFGRSEDTKIAKEAFEFAYNFIYKEGNKHYNRAYSMGRCTKGIFNSYATGFIIGLKEKLGEQAAALMIVTPEDVEEKYEEMTKDWKGRTNSMRATEYNEKAFRKGKSDAQAIYGKKALANG